MNNWPDRTDEVWRKWRALPDNQERCVAVARFFGALAAGSPTERATTILRLLELAIDKQAGADIRWPAVTDALTGGNNP